MTSRLANERALNTSLLLLVPPGLMALAWAVYNFPKEKIGGGLLTLSFVTIVFSGFLRVQLPRTKLHLTLSDAFIFLTLLFYGGGVAVPVAMAEAAFSSLRLRSEDPNHERISKRMMLMNVLIAGFSTFSTAFVVEAMFGSEEAIIIGGDTASLVYLLSVMAITQFATNTSLVSAYVAAQKGTNLFEVWNGYCFNALTMFCSGALMAGLSAKAILKTEMVPFAIGAAFLSIIYITYRRYSNDVTRASSEVERSEIARAHEAEAHIAELNHYVDELQKTAAELTQSRESFRHAAFHDALTDLPNRRHILHSLQELIESTASGTGPEFAVLLLNLNRFRIINESLGYQTGDRVIRHIGKRLVELVSETDIVGHFGGDDFVIILKNISGPDVAEAFAETVVSNVGEAIRFKGKQVYTSVSVGMVLGSEADRKPEEILRDADIAMHQAKDNRKGWMAFDRSMRALAVTRQQLETDLRYAIVCNELEMFYQPIVDLETLRLSGFEALVRWNHPQKGMIFPDEFIPVSEDTGLVIPMTLQALRSSCEQLVAWQNSSRQNRDLTISVNLSGKHFGDSSLVPQVRKIIKETGVKPQCLKLEITESAAMEDAEITIEKLIELKKTGVKISMDDFGTGYSSLSYLRRFPIDTLKIDRSFVSNMDDAADNDEIVRTIMALAKALDLSVVAEGIEDVQQLINLRRLGCEFGQGYLFSPPVPVSAAEELVRDPSRWRNLLPETGFPLGSSDSEYLESEFTN